MTKSKNVLYLKNYERKKFDIKYDSIFKCVFGKVENEKFTKKLLELILKIKIEKIDVSQDVSVEREMRDDKLGILDVRAIVNDEIVVNIEMQRENLGNIEERTEKYGSNIYSGVIKKGEKYEEAKQVILINILDYTMNKYEEYMSKTVTVLELHREEEIRTKIKYYFIELPKIDKKDIDMEDELVQWLVYIYGKDRRLVEMALAKNKMLREVDREVKYLQGEEAERRMQQLRDKWDFTMKCCIRDAKAEGERRGEKRGRKAGNIEKLTEIVKRMLELNIDKDKIMQITGIEQYDLERIISKQI